MAQKVTVTYSSPGLQPPVYITTSLSEPQWELLEMDCRKTPDGEREFAKTFHVAGGEYQYKFRLGPGDWWVCDSGVRIIRFCSGLSANIFGRAFTCAGVARHVVWQAKCLQKNRPLVAHATIGWR